MGYFKRFYTAGKPPPSTGVVEEKSNQEEVFPMAGITKPATANPVAETEIKEGATFTKERLLKTPPQTLLKIMIRVHKQATALQTHAKSDAAKLTDAILALQSKKPAAAAPAAPKGKTTAAPKKEEKQEETTEEKPDLKKDPVAYRKALVAIVNTKLKPAGSTIKVYREDTLEQVEEKIVAAVLELGEKNVEVEFHDENEVPYLEAAGVDFGGGAEEQTEETGTEEGTEDTGTTDEDAGAAAAAEETTATEEDGEVDPEKVNELLTTAISAITELAGLIGIDLGND